MENSIIVKLSGICKEFRFGKNQSFLALDGIDLELRPGDIRGLVGPSGSGKTTLMNIMGLIDQPTKGMYWFDGRDVSSLSEAELTRLRARSISFMFQENYLIPYLSAFENVLLPAVQIENLNSEKKTRAKELLDQVGLGAQCNKRVVELSGGQRQRVCIARALFKNPRLIIADEPSASLDSKTTHEIIKVFLEIQSKEKCSIIIATHDKTVIDMLQGNLLMIHDGRLIQ
jgi:putative ABC transport system ATP-binding protein